MPPIPRYRAQASQNPVAIFLSAGFRPFFLFAALWAAVGLPLSIAYLEAAAELLRLLGHNMPPLDEAAE